MYRDFILRKFLTSEKLGFWKRPHLPGGKLGRILASETRIKQPGDVIAMHYSGGTFGKTYLILTETEVYHPNGNFLIEDLKMAERDGREIKVTVNRMGESHIQTVKAKNDEAARLIYKILDDLAYFDPESEGKEEDPEEKYAAFEGQAIDWLLLRDEVMKTIDLLHERFQDGKLSLLEYDSKKAELLSRL